MNPTLNLPGTGGLGIKWLSPVWDDCGSIHTSRCCSELALLILGSCLQNIGKKLVHTSSTLKLLAACCIWYGIIIIFHEKAPLVLILLDWPTTFVGINLMHIPCNVYFDEHPAFHYSITGQHRVVANIVGATFSLIMEFCSVFKLILFILIRNSSLTFYGTFSYNKHAHVQFLHCTDVQSSW